MRRVLVIALLALCTRGDTPLAAQSGAAPLGDAARARVVELFDIRAADLRAVEGGAVVAMTLDAADDSEVASLGLVRLAVPPAFYVEQMQDVQTFRTGDAVVQVGTFSRPARLADLAELALEPDDLSDLRRCRVSDCGVQLPAEVITQLASQVPWTAPDARERATALMHAMLTRYVAAYQRLGDAALMQYDDAKPPVSVGEAFARLRADSPGILAAFPALDRHLQRFPDTEPGTRDLFYWTRERQSGKVGLTVTHLAIVPTPGDSAIAFASASKQIYATHYFDTSLGLTLLLHDPGAAPGGGTLLVYANRSRIDVLGGFLGGLKRALIRSRVKGVVENNLRGVRDRLERAYAEQRAAR
ncbi:MAG: hypothetical protein AB7G23_03725 [Vicinamibacterales bacterium]